METSKIITTHQPGTKITTAEEANSAHRRIVGTVQDAIAIGEFLAAKKTELPYGQWGKWAKENLEFDQKTEWNYRNLYEHRATLGTVPKLTEAYRLLSSSAPELEEQPRHKYIAEQYELPIKDITPEVIDENDESAAHVSPVKSWTKKGPDDGAEEGPNDVCEVGWLLLVSERDAAVLALTPSNKRWEKSALRFFGSLREREIVTVS
jgi:hypothetical protein